MISETEIQNIYKTQFPKLYKYFYFKLLSKENAEDLVSQTFLSFIRSIKEQDGIDDYIKFLYGIAKNVFFEFLRNKYRTYYVSGIDLDLIKSESVEDFIEQIEEKDSIEQRAMIYIEKLPEKQKQVLYLRLIEKCSLKDICLKLGKDMNYVKTTQKRALKNIKLLACTPVTTNILVDKNGKKSL